MTDAVNVSSQLDLERETVRVADTETVKALNADCIRRDRWHVLSADLIERLDPNGLHLLWAAFPHSQSEVIVRLADATQSGPAGRIRFRNGSPGWPSRPHVRTAWLLTVQEGDPKEGIIHLDHGDVVALPVYTRPADSHYPPAPESHPGEARQTLRAATTDQLLALNASSVSKNHNKILDQRTLDRLDPAGIHLMWGTFPHDQRTLVTARAEAILGLPSEIDLRNGSPGSPDIPHLRTMWLLSVTDGDPVEAHVHLDYSEVAGLPEYQLTHEADEC